MSRFLVLYMPIQKHPYFLYDQSESRRSKYFDLRFLENLVAMPNNNDFTRKSGSHFIKYFVFGNVEALKIDTIPENVTATALLATVFTTPQKHGSL
jgi:hypothetical protein